MTHRFPQPSSTLPLILLGLVTLALGALFFIPGFMMCLEAFHRFRSQGEPPDMIMLFITTFLLLLGTILIFVALQFISGHLPERGISRPVLALATFFFLGLSCLFVVEGLFLDRMPTGYPFARGLGAAFVLGIASLRLFIWKSRRRIPAQKPTNR